MTERALADGMHPLAALDRGIHQVRITRELEPLAALYGETWKTSRPLRCAGFDCHLSSRRPWTSVAGDIVGWFPEVDGDREILEALARSTIPFERNASSTMPGGRWRAASSRGTATTFRRAATGSSRAAATMRRASSSAR